LVLHWYGDHKCRDVTLLPSSSEVIGPRPHAGWLQASQTLLTWTLEGFCWDRRLLVKREEGENLYHHRFGKNILKPKSQKWI
jgi:hypothetical protein